MSDPVLRAYTIGQTPRPDLTAELERRLPGTAVSLVGALDGIRADRIETCGPCEYPLETRLRDGTRIVIDAPVVEAHLQRALDGWEGEALAHIVLCAGPFPSLSIAPGPRRRAAPLVRPFESAVPVLRERGFRRLAVVVPFAAQALPAEGKWRSRGFDPVRVRPLTEKPTRASVAEWVAAWVAGSHVQAVLFDYVGFPPHLLEGVAGATGLPVIDLGHLAFDLLTDTLHAP